MSGGASTVFVIDDEPAVRASLELLIRAEGFQVRSFESAQSYLDAFDAEARGCLVCDLRMPGLNGLELQQEMVSRDCRIPIIFLTGHGDVPAAVQALKAGALDFLQKPFNPDTLIERIGRAIELDDSRRAFAHREAEVEARAGTLTPREKQVMDAIVAGDANKVIAIELGISERTVELHRGRVMKKMRATSVADLVRLVEALQQRA